MIDSIKKFEDILLDAGIINKKQLAVALEKQKTWGGRLEEIMLELGFFDEEFLLELESERFQIQRINISEKNIDEKLLEIFPKEYIIEYTFLPVEENAHSVTICISDPSNKEAMLAIQRHTKKKLTFVLDTEKALTKAINHYFHTNIESRDYSREEKHDERLFEKTVKSFELRKFDIFQKEAFSEKTNSLLINAIFSIENVLKKISQEADSKLSRKMKNLVKLLNKKGFRIPSYEDK